MIKIGFELELDEGTYTPSSSDVVQGLAEALPKAWWADHREGNWGVKALFALNDDGTLMQHDQRLRPIPVQIMQPSHEEIKLKATIGIREHKIEVLKADLDQERNLTRHLDKERGQQDTAIVNLEAQVENLIEKNDNQAAIIDESRDLQSRYDNSLLDWKACTERNRTFLSEKATEDAVNEEMISKIMDAMEGAGFEVKNGWGNDTELEELETASTQIEDHLQAAQKYMVTLTRFLTDAQDEVGNISMGIEDASSEQDGLDSLLDHIRTRR